MAPVHDVKLARVHPGPERPAFDALDLQVTNGEFLSIEARPRGRSVDGSKIATTPT